ncbi:MAG: hypothetical protein JWR55_444 [Aeromicrobium sp.]|jgi:hypothetical protein|nr:hypothetical protein [Aeromicrobium sp.]
MLLRRTCLSIAGALVATAVSVPAQGAPEPTTLAVEGTIEVLVVDHFDADVSDPHHEAHSERIYTLVTDDGAEIPIELDSDAPADARFRGELVVDGAVASALDRKDLLPAEGGTIAEDTRAGRTAIAVAEDQTTPLTVESSRVSPVLAAAATPIVHRAYIAKMTGAGSVEGTAPELAAAVDGMLAYWELEPGATTSFDRALDIRTFAAPAGVTAANGCGMTEPDTYIQAVFNEAAQQFSPVNFNAPGNHLVILAGDECGDSGPVGIANVGASINDGGASMITFDPATFNQTGAHEIGHNFGLEHANLNDSASPDPRFNEYLDLYSPMGLSIDGSPGGLTFSPPSLGSLYRAQLGLNTTDEIAGVALAPGQSSLQQSFAIGPRSATSGLRSTFVTDPYTGTTYSVDFRSGAGRDNDTFYAYGATLDTPYSPVYDLGVVIERQSASRETFLMTQPGADPREGAFWTNDVFAPSPGLRITIGALAPSGAPVSVQLTARAAAPKRLGAKTPTIRGTARVGRTLKVRVGSWSPRPSYRYQWYANGKKITSKGTRSYLKLTSRQKGKRITVKVTGTKAGYATVTKTSARTKKVTKR